MIIQTKSFISTCIFLLIVHFLSAQSYKVTTEIKVLESNGAQENITLSVNNFDTNPIHVSIVNVLGQVINQYVLDRNNNSINIQHLENGIYFFILRKQGLEQTQKICVLR